MGDDLEVRVFVKEAAKTICAIALLIS